MINDSLNSEQKLNPILELDQQVSRLIDQYTKLEKENELLRSEQKKLSSQITSLTDTSSQVKMKIESLLGRLKALGQEAT